MKKLFFIYPTNRDKIYQDVKNGYSPDNALYGLNYLEKTVFHANYKDVSARLERLLDIIFLPFHKLFFSQIDIDFKLGRAFLLLPFLNKDDCIVVNTDGIGLAICFLKRLKLIRKPVVYAVGLFYINGNLKTTLEKNKKTPFVYFFKWILTAADQILYHAPIEKEKLIKLGIYNPATCAFLPMGSDANFFNMSRFIRLKTLKNTVISIGKDRARDYKTLISTANTLPRVSFIIICKKDNLENLELPTNVKVYFDLPYYETAQWYKKATIIVIPIKEMNRSSGQMTLTDCIQCSKPIIISDVVGIEHYFLKNYSNIIKVSPQNSKQLKSAIKFLLKSKNMQNKLKKNTKELAKIYNTKNYAMGLSQIIFSAMDEFKLIPLDKTNLEFVRKTRNENFSFFINQQDQISKNDQKKWFHNYLQKRDDYMFTLVKNHLKIGVGAIYDINLNKKTAKIGRFIVDGKFRNRGYGRVLLDKIEQVAFDRLGMESLKLEVLVENKIAIKLYKHDGFVGQKYVAIRGKKILIMFKRKPHQKLAV